MRLPFYVVEFTYKPIPFVTQKTGKKRENALEKYSGRNNFLLIETQSPFSVFGEIIGRGAPFPSVSIHCTAVIEFTIELERKYATAASRIAAMSVEPAFTVVCKKDSPRHLYRGCYTVTRRYDFYF